MPKSLLEMVSEIVSTQTTQKIMSAEELDRLIKQTYRSLKEIETIENRGGALEEIGTTIEVRILPQDAPYPETALKTEHRESISNDAIVCLECGKEFKSLTHTHLKEHALSAQDYRRKHGIPPKQALAAGSVSNRRKAQARERNIGEQLKLARAAKRAEQSNGKAIEGPAPAKDKESWLVQMLEEEGHDRSGNFWDANFKRINET